MAARRARDEFGDLICPVPGCHRVIRAMTGLQELVKFRIHMNRFHLTNWTMNDALANRHRIESKRAEIKASKANYAIISDTLGELAIKDLGPWDKFQTITNAAEEVVEELVASGQLKPDQKLFYFDSEGELDEILVKDGKFAGFRPGCGA